MWKDSNKTCIKQNKKLYRFLCFFFVFFLACLSDVRERKERKKETPLDCEQRNKKNNTNINNNRNININNNNNNSITNSSKSVFQVFFCCFSFACAVWRSHVFAAPTATPAATRLPFDKCKEIPMRPFSTSSTVYFVYRLLLQCLAAAVSVAVAATATVTVTSTATATATPADATM